MKLTDKDFEYEALHQGVLMNYKDYQIKWSTTPTMGFIKFVKPNTSMKDEIRFNIRTGRQIVVNESTATIDKDIVELAFACIKAISTRTGAGNVTLLNSAINCINCAHAADEDTWERITNKINKLIVLPKKKGE